MVYTEILYLRVNMQEFGQYYMVASGLVGSEESDLGFPLHPEYAIQTDANWYFLHGIFD